MSFALVVAATITLVVGLLQSGLTLIYVSIACSVLAGLVLAVAVLRGRPEEAAAPAAPARGTAVPAGVGASASAPPAGRPWETTSTETAQTATVPSWRSDAPVSPTPVPPSAMEPEPEMETETEPEPEPEPEPEYAGVLARRFARDRDSTEQVDVVSLDDEEEDEELEDEEEAAFPIANYERLRASEILRQLPELNRNQLEQVRQRELAGMNRFTVLSRIEAQLEASAPETSGDWDIGEREWEARDDDEDMLERPVIEPIAPVPAPPARRRATTRRPSAAAPAAAARKAPTRKAAAEAIPAAPARKAPARKRAPVESVPAAIEMPSVAPARGRKAAGVGKAPGVGKTAGGRVSVAGKAPAPVKKAGGKKAAPTTATAVKKAAARKTTAGAPAPRKAGAAKSPLTAKDAVAKARANLAEKAAVKKTTRPRKAPPTL